MLSTFGTTPGWVFSLLHVRTKLHICPRAKVHIVLLRLLNPHCICQYLTRFPSISNSSFSWSIIECKTIIIVVVGVRPDRLATEEDHLKSEPLLVNTCECSLSLTFNSISAPVPWAQSRKRFVLFTVVVLIWIFLFLINFSLSNLLSLTA